MQDFALVASGPNTANGKHLEASRQYHYAAAEGVNGESIGAAGGDEPFKS